MLKNISIRGRTRLHGNLSGALPKDNAWNNSDLGVAPRTAEVRTCINSLILARMGQVRNPLAPIEKNRCRWSGCL